MPSKEEFGQWKHDPVTKSFFRWVAGKYAQTEEDILSDAIIFRADGQLKLCRLSGMRDILERIENLSVEDLDDEETQSAGLQGTSAAKRHREEERSNF